MRLSIRRSGLVILPEEPTLGSDKRDIAYFEEVMGLCKEGDTCICRRVDGADGKLRHLAILSNAKEKDDGNSR